MNETAPTRDDSRPSPSPPDLLEGGFIQPSHDGDTSVEHYPMADLSFNISHEEDGTRRLSNASLISAASSQARRKKGTPVVQAWKTVTNRVEAMNTGIADRIRKSRYHGWRMGVLVGCCTSAFVLCCNIAIVIVGSRVQGGYKQDGIADLIVGPATSISRWSTAAHLLINVFSTMLLGASNYTMQVLSSPTREDIDKAHARGRWLDIGLLSTRNLRNIPGMRAMVWCLLAASSIPLHLFYNAAVFQIATYNMYNMIAIDQTSAEYQPLLQRVEMYPNGTTFSGVQGTHKNLTNDAWRRVYGTKYVSEHGDLYLIMDTYGFESSQDSVALNISKYYPLEIGGTEENFQEINNLGGNSFGGWINHRNFAKEAYSTNNATFYDEKEGPLTAHVTHAIAKKVSPESRLQISLIFMLVVIAFNSFKLAIMTWVLYTDRSAYIVTLGDAAASFLKRPDPITQHQCMLGREEVLFRLGHVPYMPPGSWEAQETLQLRSQGIWLRRKREYFFVLSRDRQMFFVLLLCVAAGATIFVPLITTMGYAWGTSSDVIVNDQGGALTNAWLVNTPQLALSFCYLALNSICTSLASAYEWNNMAKTRKSLRVTDPQGLQRSTYFLQLPYRWATPLIIISGTLHWLLSQSFFVVRLDMLNRDGIIEEQLSRSACGFAQLSMIVFWSVFLVLLVGISVFATRRMQEKLPVAASCSLAISAACHPGDGEVDGHLAKLRWGVISKQLAPGYDHCCLTTLQGTKKPVVGQEYH